MLPLNAMRNSFLMSLEKTRWNVCLNKDVLNESPITMWPLHTDITDYNTAHIAAHCTLYKSRQTWCMMNTNIQYTMATSTYWMYKTRLFTQCYSVCHNCPSPFFCLNVLLSELHWLLESCLMYKLVPACLSVYITALSYPAAFPIVLL